MTKEEIMQENTRLAAEIQGLKKKVEACEESRAFWKREWRLSEDGNFKAQAYIRKLEDQRTLDTLNMAGYKHTIDSMHKMMFEAESQRRRDAIDGQGAMEERDNQIVSLQAEMKMLQGLLHHRTERYFELLNAVESKWPGENRHTTALRYIRSIEHPGPPTPRGAGPSERDYCL